MTTFVMARRKRIVTKMNRAPPYVMLAVSISA